MVNHLDFLGGAAEHGTSLANAGATGQRQLRRYQQVRAEAEVMRIRGAI